MVSTWINFIPWSQKHSKAPLLLINESTLDTLLDYARLPVWRGSLSGGTHYCRQRNRTCGDEVAFELLLHGDRIADIRFTGRGCFLSQATASLLCERIVQRTLSELRELSAEELLGFDPATVSPMRQRCCLLGVEALQNLLAAPEQCRRSVE